MGLQCPFCKSEGWTDETDRLAHVLDAHSAALFMVGAIFREFHAQHISWDTYHEWLDLRRADKPRLGR